MWFIGTLWGNFTSGAFEFAMSGYSNLEPWTYPLILVGIIGYVFMATHSVVTSIVAILVTFGVYLSTGVFVDVPSLSLILFLITLIGIVLLVFILVLKVVDRI